VTDGEELEDFRLDFKGFPFDNTIVGVDTPRVRSGLAVLVLIGGRVGVSSGGGETEEDRLGKGTALGGEDGLGVVETFTIFSSLWALSSSCCSAWEKPSLDDSSVASSSSLSKEKTGAFLTGVLRVNLGKLPRLANAPGPRSAEYVRLWFRESDLANIDDSVML
jgi:hypothetical protein